MRVVANGVPIVRAATRRGSRYFARGACRTCFPAPSTSGGGPLIESLALKVSRGGGCTRFPASWTAPGARCTGSGGVCTASGARCTGGRARFFPREARCTRYSGQPQRTSRSRREILRCPTEIPGSGRGTAASRRRGSGSFLGKMRSVGGGSAFAGGGSRRRRESHGHRARPGSTIPATTGTDSGPPGCSRKLSEFAPAYGLGDLLSTGKKGCVLPKTSPEHGEQYRK